MTSPVEVEPDNDCPLCVPYVGRTDDHFVGMRWSPGDPILRFGPEEQQP
jgi:hypothetical protein